MAEGFSSLYFFMCSQTRETRFCSACRRGDAQQKLGKLELKLCKEKRDAFSSLPHFQFISFPIACAFSFLLPPLHVCQQEGMCCVHSVRYSVASQCCWLPWSCSGSPELAVIKALEHSNWRTASQSLLPATHWQGFDIRVCTDVTSA